MKLAPALTEALETVSEIARDQYGATVDSWLDAGRQPHRSADLPAVVTRRPDGSVSMRQWLQHGMPCRPSGGPTAEGFDPAGNLISRTWQRRDGQLHRIGGPARIEYGRDGEVVARFWVRNGMVLTTA